MTIKMKHYNVFKRIPSHDHDRHNITNKLLRILISIFDSNYYFNKSALKLIKLIIIIGACKTILIHKYINKFAKIIYIFLKQNLYLKQIDSYLSYFV